MCVGKVETAKINMPFRTRKSGFKKLKVSSDSDERITYQEDILAISTYYTKIVLFTFGDLFQGFQDSTFYRFLFHTTQPAHIVTALSVLVLCYLIFPNSTSKTFQSPLWSLIYLGSFCAHFGAQIWMTFISGLSLYFALPRHTFGSIQQVLFPKYFLLNATLSLITLAIFIQRHDINLASSPIILQVAGMTLCFLTELIIRLYLTPPLLRLMTIKNAMEKEAGVGMEVGRLVAGDLLKCPHYIKIHKAFRRVHMTIAIGNIFAMSCTMFHLYYLAHKLCVL